MTQPHDWHKFDDKYEVRQVTEDDQPNQWAVRKIGHDEPGTILSDEEFNQFRSEGISPRGLD